MRFVIVTGLSGAGKTQTIRCLEDFGYFCIDNIPPTLIHKFAEIAEQSHGNIDKVAVVIDMRVGELFDDLLKELKDLNKNGFRYEILFLDASDEVLVKRFKETRRRHPLVKNGRIINAIHEERIRLDEIRSKADNIVDTSKISTRQLREELRKIYLDGEDFESLVINVMSFGFKYGVPIDCDLVFDVRFLPNPYYVEDLKPYSGNEKMVKDYVFKYQETTEFIKKVTDLLEFLIPNYIKEGKTNLVIGIGCTGGRHRSVAISNAIYEILNQKGHTAHITHRDIMRDTSEDAK